MTRNARFWCVMVVMATVCAAPCAHVSAQPSVDPAALEHGDPATRPNESDRLFLQLLQEAIVNDTRAWVADQVSYPITVTIGGQRRPIKTRKELLAHYGDIINARVRNAVLAQRFEHLFRNWRGTMIGQGLVWFDGVYQADGCQQGSQPDNRVVSCDLDRTWRVMIRAINNDFDPESGTPNPRK